MTPAFLEATLDGRREEAATLLGADLPAEFPREGERRFLTLRLRQMREDAGFEDWSPFAVVLEGRMIGHAGYHGPPGSNTRQNPDAVEIGYTIEPEYRRRGFATAAATELIRRAEERGIRHIIACSSPGNEPSLAIIRGLGFTQTGEAMDEEDGLELVFEREPLRPARARDCPNRSRVNRLALSCTSGHHVAERDAFDDERRREDGQTPVEQVCPSTTFVAERAHDEEHCRQKQQEASESEFHHGPCVREPGNNPSMRAERGLVRLRRAPVGSAS